MPEYTDKDLLHMFQDADKRHLAFNLLIRKHQQKLYFFVRRMVIDHSDADDVLQNVFIKIWHNLTSFREDAKFITWAYRICVNESITFLKNKRLRSIISFSSLETQMLNTLNDDNYFEGSEIQKKLQQAIIKLPEKQRAIFNMRYYDELSYEEISEILGTSVGALKASYHIAKEKIEKFVLNH